MCHRAVRNCSQIASKSVETAKEGRRGLDRQPLKWIQGQKVPPIACDQNIGSTHQRHFKNEIVAGM
jgi:hypothetical protein